MNEINATVRKKYTPIEKWSGVIQSRHQAATFLHATCHKMLVHHPVHSLVGGALVLVMVCLGGFPHRQHSSLAGRPQRE